MTTMKHASARAINGESALHGPRGNSGLRGVVRHSARIQGGNWNRQEFRPTGHVYDEAECQISIAEFMTGQERNENLE
jgi:hypothetical protein